VAMRMRRPRRWPRALAVLCASALPVIAPADAPPGYGPRRAQLEAEYARGALDAYGKGYAQIESARRCELDATASTDERARSEARAQAVQKYEEALRSFAEATRAEPRMYEAHTYVGYANRKLGRYIEALGAYEQALRIKPDYAQAIEYQGETFLELNRFERARIDYLRLYALDSVQAGKLLDAMKAWSDERKRDAGGLSARQLEDAMEWIDSRPSFTPAADPNGW
jgi:tetratricopeptide (TPR) repeat protein